MSNDKNTVVIYNVKSSSYRQIHVDGASGGITPSGNLNLSFYGERAAIPKGTEYELSDEGKIVKSVANVDGSKDGIIREYEFGAYLSLEVCESLKRYLEGKIEELKKLK